MRKIEKKTLQKMLEQIQHHSATAAQFIPKEDGGYKHIDSTKEAMRLMDSEDYKKGWMACQERVKHIIEWLLTAKDGELNRYVR